MHGHLGGEACTCYRSSSSSGRGWSFIDWNETDYHYIYGHFFKQLVKFEHNCEVGRIFFHCSSRFVLTILFCRLYNTWYFLRLCSLKSLSTAETDPRFSIGGGQPRGGGVRQPNIFSKYLPKTAWKWKNYDGGERFLAPPLDPPL